jgi:hypothetical protein
VPFLVWGAEVKAARRFEDRRDKTPCTYAFIQTATLDPFRIPLVVNPSRCRALLIFTRDLWAVRFWAYA